MEDQNTSTIPAGMFDPSSSLLGVVCLSALPGESALSGDEDSWPGRDSGETNCH